MKIMKSSLTLILLSFMLLTAYSCKDSKQTSPAKTEEAKQGKEYTSDYICPMHCEGSGSENPGKCPVCKMDYVLNEDYKSSEDHDHDHGDHDHNHEGDDHHGHSHDGDDHSGHNH